MRKNEFNIGDKVYFEQEYRSTVEAVIVGKRISKTLFNNYTDYVVEWIADRYLNDYRGDICKTIKNDIWRATTTELHLIERK